MTEGSWSALLTKDTTRLVHRSLAHTHTYVQIQVHATCSKGSIWSQRLLSVTRLRVCTIATVMKHDQQTPASEESAPEQVTGQLLQNCFRGVKLYEAEIRAPAGQQGEGGARVTHVCSVLLRHCMRRGSVA